MRKPLAVVTGDVHMTLNTLEVATEAIIQMQDKALELQVSIILNGDTLDSKAILRGEVVNRLIKLLTRSGAPTTYFNTGNHEMINTKGNEHTLHFLKPYAQVIDIVSHLPELGVYMVPYIDDKDTLSEALRSIPDNAIVLVHQGIDSADMGHYILDTTSLDKSYFSRFRTIGSHYHKRQDIDCNTGVFSYLGNLYTLGYGEANDPEKGFQILYDDGSLEFVPTNLRKHVVINGVINSNGRVGYEGSTAKINHDDIIWLKLSGPSDQLAKHNKATLADAFGLTGNFRLDLIPTDTKSEKAEVQAEMPQAELLDSLIDSLRNTDVSRKERLKNLWKALK